jgi:hypothetical protein
MTVAEVALANLVTLHVSLASPDRVPDWGDDPEELHDLRRRA